MPHTFKKMFSRDIKSSLNDFGAHLNFINCLDLDVDKSSNISTIKFECCKINVNSKSIVDISFVLKLMSRTK